MPSLIIKYLKTSLFSLISSPKNLEAAFFPTLLFFPPSRLPLLQSPHTVTRAEVPGGDASDAAKGGFFSNFMSATKASLTRATSVVSKGPADAPQPGEVES
ncbi:hypothetical protein E2C01_077938 [Portunus trituberculatus]|uniref:Uncharacterized protein n=1 Tax=Portunus trituberculatus TaxID=210409 RepID=A0A5B7ISS9_PORTR|nr:hypothetical protein [Portunus trituberculatus]